VPHEAGVVDAEAVEHGHESLGMCPDVDGMAARRVAPAEAQQVQDENAVAGGELGDDVAPEVAGGGKTVDQDDRLTGSAGAGRVVIEPDAVEVEKLTAHWNNIGNRGDENEGRG
jgi:hypothetical protein